MRYLWILIGLLAFPIFGNDYLPVFIQRAEATKSAFDTPLKRRPHRSDPRSGPRAMITQSELCLRTGKAVGRKDLTELGVKLYDMYLNASPVTGYRSDFHETYPFGITALLMHENGLLTGERRAKTRKLAADYFANFQKGYTPEKLYGTEKFFDHNIHMANIAAADALAIVFLDDKELPVAKIRAFVRDFCDRVLKNGDLNENATNYSSLGCVFFLSILKMENRLPELKNNAGFRNLFTRWRDFSSPGVFFPEFGDSYFKAQLVPFDLILMMETAARLYDDGSFAAEARKLMTWYRGQIDDEFFFRAIALIDLKPWQGDVSAADSKSGVQLRRTYDGQSVFDKMILKTGNRPGDAMILLDLYAGGSHAHRSRRSAVIYYEKGGMPLFHNLGRHSVSAGNYGNTFWTAETPTGIPGHPKPNQWNTMTIPVEHLQPAAEKGKYVLKDRSLNFRTFKQPRVKSVWFDNLRLEGPAGTKLIDDFEDGSLWPERTARDIPGWQAETSDDHTTGSKSQKISWAPFNGHVFVRLLPEPFRNFKVDPADYDCIRFDYKYEGIHPLANLRGWCFDWLTLGEATLPCRITAAEARQLGEDALGVVEYQDYQGRGNTLQRRMLLTREGVLIINDRYRGKARSQGQLWQLYTLSERGTDYFVAGSDGAYPQSDGKERPERRMLVRYFGPAGTEFGVEEVLPGALHAATVDGKKYQSFFTTFSRSGQPGEMTQVILPLLPGDQAAELAAGIRVVPKGGDVEITFRAPGSGERVECLLKDRDAQIRRVAP